MRILLTDIACVLPRLFAPVIDRGERQVLRRSSGIGTKTPPQPLGEVPAVFIGPPVVRHAEIIHRSDWQGRGGGRPRVRH